MYKVKVLMTGFVTHDTKRFVVEKPKNYNFVPGQATMVSIDKKGWQNEKRPFTFTSLNDDLVLEFTLKRYPDHKGVTEQMHNLKPGDRLVIEKPFGAIKYKGPGTFIAAGTGITPFIAIFRQLKKDNKVNGNKLIFSNKTHDDIILEPELKHIFGSASFICTLTREKCNDYASGRINENFLKSIIKDFKQHFYICGQPNFVLDIKNILKKFGAKSDQVVIEE